MIVCYPSHDINLFWPKVRPFIMEALNRGSTWTIGEVYEALINKKAQLWTWQDPDIRAVMVTTLQDDYCLILTLAGEGLRQWIDHIKTVDEWAREKGCRALRVHGRKGWSRFGFNVIGRDADLYIMERKLWQADPRT